jgi:hypothetical protein
MNKNEMITLFEEKYLYKDYIKKIFKKEWNYLKTIKDEEEFFYESSLFINIKLDPHTKLIDRNVYNYILPIFFTVMNNSIVVIDTTPGYQIYDIKGYILTHINGVSLEDFIKNIHINTFNRGKVLELLKIIEILSNSSNFKKINLTFSREKDIVVLDVEYLSKEYFIKERSINLNDKVSKQFINIFGNDICYIRIPSLNDEKMVDKIIEQIIIQGKKYNLLLDIRNNVGGKITVAKKLSKLFIKQNFKIFLKNNTNYLEEINIEPNITEFKYPITILFNNMTSSSLEYIFLRSLANDKDILFIGNETSGMKDIATVYNINERYTLILTTKKYATSDGYDLECTNIKPDIEIKTEISDYTNYPDKQLLKAIEIIRRSKL